MLGSEDERGSCCFNRGNHDVMYTFKLAHFHFDSINTGVNMVNGGRQSLEEC